MDEYIRRDAAKKEMGRFIGYAGIDEDMVARFWIAIDRLPAADVAPVVHAEWIVIAEYVDYVSARCGHCRVPQHFYYNKPLTKYCPNCGAVMDGGEKNAE